MNDFENTMLEMMSELSVNMVSMGADISTLKEDLAAVKEEVTSVKEDLTAVKEEVTSVKEEVTAVKEEVTSVREDLTSVKEEVTSIKKDVRELKDSVTKLEITQENEILPRLKEIESCYLDTYKRYQEGNDDIESLKVDVTTIKNYLAKAN